jgi:rare lipoprotein A
VINRIILIITFLWLGHTFLPAQEKGMASYYSNRLHGRRMSDGTRYHRDSLICAHKKYELGTMLKVTNIKNGKSVVVRVADRCSGRRIIDLSYAAAEEIDIISSGVAMVKVEKYKMERGIPYKREIDDDLPELDFEITEKDSYFKPNWGRNDRKNKEKEKKIHKMNNKNNKK